jgi:hypothetical protein
MSGSFTLPSSLKKINKERLFLNKPLFGIELAGPDKLPFDSEKKILLGHSAAVLNLRNAQVLNRSGLSDFMPSLTLSRGGLQFPKRTVGKGSANVMPAR